MTKEKAQNEPSKPSSLAVGLDKSLDGPVISPLDISREVTGRQFTQLLVICKTFAAYTFSGARLVGAVALNFILLNFAFSHGNSS
jgi:hypothetical protein